MLTMAACKRIIFLVTLDWQSFAKAGVSLNSTFMDIVRVIYCRRKFVAIATAVAFLLALGRYLIWESPTFEAETMLLVTTPELDMEQRDRLAPAPLNPKIYGEILGSNEVLLKVIETLEAKQLMASVPDLKALETMVDVRVGVVDQTTRPIQYSPVLTLTVRADSEENARAIIDVWAAVGLEVAEKAIELQVGQFARALDKAKRARLEHLDKLRQAREEEMAKLDTDTVQEELRQLSALGVRLVESRNLAEQRLSAAQEKLKTVQTALATEKPLVQLFKAPDDVAYWLLEGERAGTRPLSEKGMVTQQVNQVYLALKNDEHAAMQEDASARAELASIDTQTAALRDRIAALQAQLAAHVVALQRVQTEEKIAATVYEAVATGTARYADAAGLVSEHGEGQTPALGLTRLLDASPVVTKGVMKSRLMVLLYTAVVFVFAIGLVLVEAYGEPFLAQVRSNLSARASGSDV